jgi:hypothetical protein
MIRYYYNENTGEITRRSEGTLHLVESNPYIESISDVDITQYTVSGGELVHTPTPKATNPRG